MKNMKSVFSIMLVILLFLAGCNQGTTTDDDAEETTTEESVEIDPTYEEIIQLAEEFIEQLHAGNYQEASEKFDGTMSELVSVADLEETWESLDEQLGGFIDKAYNEVEEVEEHKVVLITGIFNDADVTFQVTFDDKQQIAGFYVI